MVRLMVSLAPIALCGMKPRRKPDIFCTFAGVKITQTTPPMETLEKDLATLEQAKDLGLLPEEFEKIKNSEWWQEIKNIK